MDVYPDVDAGRGHLACKIEQSGRNIGILFVCYVYGEPEFSARFIMWDVVTQITVAVGFLLQTTKFRSEFTDLPWVVEHKL